MYKNPGSFLVTIDLSTIVSCIIPKPSAPPVVKSIAPSPACMLKGLELSIASSALDASILSETKDSIAVTNPIPATGGRGEESLKEIKENTKAYFQAQNRSVSKEDYITRVYNLPAKYGNVQKIYINQDDQLQTGEGIIQDGIINMETLEKLRFLFQDVILLI